MQPTRVKADDRMSRVGPVMFCVALVTFICDALTIFSKTIARLSPCCKPSLASEKKEVLSKLHISASFARDLRKASPSVSLPKMPAVLDSLHLRRKCSTKMIQPAHTKVEASSVFVLSSSCDCLLHSRNGFCVASKVCLKDC